MSRLEQIEIRMRLVVEGPVPGVMHSLQDKTGAPVDAKCSISSEPLSFEFPIRVVSGPKFLGEHVRNGGAERRFVYIALGKQAGDAASCWDRRMKIDIHSIPTTLIDAAAKRSVLEGTVYGTGADGSPVCATVPVKAWRAV